MKFAFCFRCGLIQLRTEKDIRNHPGRPAKWTDEIFENPTRTFRWLVRKGSQTWVWIDDAFPLIEWQWARCSSLWPRSCVRCLHNPPALQQWAFDTLQFPFPFLGFCGSQETVVPWVVLPWYWGRDRQEGKEFTLKIRIGKKSLFGTLQRITE